MMATGTRTSPNNGKNDCYVRFCIFFFRPLQNKNVKDEVMRNATMANFPYLISELIVGIT